VLTHHRVSRVLTHRGRVHSVVAGPETAGAAGRRAAAEEDIPADVVVLAAGAWTPSLAEDLGLDIPMIPAKGYSCTVDAYPGGPSLPIYLKERRVAITPLGPRLRIGGTLELIGFQEGLNRRRYDAVVAGARLALNDAFRLENEEAWFGFRPVLPDGLPIISTVPDVAGLIIAAGHAMLGFTLAPVTGNLVAELADGRAPSAPVEPFRIDRFDPAR
jgi:D-amino-acid dehydrogenase